MPENIQRSRGRPSNYRQDRGGVPAEYGPYYGEVMNNVDPTRTGRLQVYIEAFSGPDRTDSTRWTTVSYLPHFYGATPPGNSPNTGAGDYAANQNSYGMWMTPPDLGVKVICIFVNGDRSQGYYIGVVIENGINHMVPAIGAEGNFVPTNDNQKAYFADSPLMPTTEINASNERFDNAGRFYETPKPIHSVVASSLFQQGLNKDIERGPVRSSSQRESPSSVFGFSSPGVPVYQGGITPQDARKKLNSGTVKPAELQVIGRMGGHSLVLDDGDIEGANNMFRVRTSKGHQITMSDSGNFVYITHANGQTWIELGVEGTVDVFSTNSINLRSQGDINIHADRDINMHAGRDMNVKIKNNVTWETDNEFRLTAQKDLRLWSKATINVKADGVLTIQSASGSWNAGSAFKMTAGGIDLNGPQAPEVAAPKPMIIKQFDTTKFSSAKGWEVEKKKLESICSRVTTHEPYPYHNKGVDVKVEFETGQPAPPPGAAPVPAGVRITAQ